MNEAGILLYYGETIGCVLFCVLYLLRSQWWRTPMGRNVLAMMFVLAVFQTLGLASRLPTLRDWFAAHADALRFWSFLALFITVWWRVIILIKIQHEDAVMARRDAEAAHDDALGARDDAAGAREDAAEARDDAAKAHEDAMKLRQAKRNGDTDPDLKPVG